MKKLISFIAIGILLLSGLGAVSGANDKTYELKTEKEHLVFSEPIIKNEGEFVTLNLKEATSYLLDGEKPSLPLVTHIFTFPFGTKIKHVDVVFSEPKNLILTKKVRPAPESFMLNTELQTTNQPEKNTETYGSAELYPSTNYSYKVGAGLANNEHVIYLTVRCYPVRYSPINNMIYYNEGAEIIVSYEEPLNPVSFPDKYDLIIISPSEFSNELQPLINHKNNYGIKTKLMTTEDIYTKYNGRDQAEKIKYFIKDALETYGVNYVLLIGGIEKLPIRTTWFFQKYHEHYWNETVLTDLYYADIYDENGSFCSWDSNGNGLYGEVYTNCPGVNDSVDLYADVNIGRIPCVDKSELNNVVNKIIHYETYTSSESWFKNIILIGGDTFPGQDGYEGEEKNNLTEQIMSDFTPTKLETSDGTFNAQAFNKALKNGAGFVDYSGHGYEIGVCTHPPNSNKWIGYYFYNLFFASNGYKLPIIFFDACLTSKLDFNTSELINYILPFNTNPNQDSKISGIGNILKSRSPLSIFEKIIPCFSWNWVKKKNGGAIATIGATRTAYTGVNGGNVYAGAGYLSIQFYRAYASSKTISQMLTKAQNNYLNNVLNDYFTVEEFILIGDPSLKPGGY